MWENISFLVTQPDYREYPFNGEWRQMAGNVTHDWTISQSSISESIDESINESIDESDHLKLLNYMFK